MVVWEEIHSLTAEQGEGICIVQASVVALLGKKYVHYIQSKLARDVSYNLHIAVIMDMDFVIPWNASRSFCDYIIATGINDEKCSILGNVKFAQSR